MCMALDAHRAFVTMAGFATDDEYVLVFTRNGEQVCRWGSRGTNPGQFERLHGVAVWQHRVLVASKDRIQSFRKDGSLEFLKSTPRNPGRLLAHHSVLFAVCFQSVDAFNIQAHTLSERFFIRVHGPLDAAANDEELYIARMTTSREDICIGVYALDDGTALREVTLRDVQLPYHFFLDDSGFLLFSDGAFLRRSGVDRDALPGIVLELPDSDDTRVPVASSVDDLFVVTRKLRLVQITGALCFHSR